MLQLLWFHLQNLPKKLWGLMTLFSPTWSKPQLKIFCTLDAKTLVLLPMVTTGDKLGNYVFLNFWAIKRVQTFQFMREEEVAILVSKIRRASLSGAYVNLSEMLVANLLYWFDWKLPCEGAMGRDLGMSEVNGLTVHRKIPLHLVPIPYSSIHHLRDCWWFCWSTPAQ